MIFFILSSLFFLKASIILNLKVVPNDIFKFGGERVKSNFYLESDKNGSSQFIAIYMCCMFITLTKIIKEQNYDKINKNKNLNGSITEIYEPWLKT